MNKFRRLAAKMDQHMQQLSAHGVHDAHAILNRMMGYVPDLHKIWVETTDDQLIALSNEYPGFYRYALIMEELSEEERNRPSRSYDGMEEFSPRHKQMANQLLTTAATIEREYQALLGSGKPKVFQLQVDSLNRMHRQWSADLESFQASLQQHGAEPRALGYVGEAFGRIAKRIDTLAAGMGEA